MEMHIHQIKDLGLHKIVLDSYPYAVVGGAWEGSFPSHLNSATLLNYIVPTGKQLKMLFLRIFTQSAGGALFAIRQTNPAVAGLTGIVEAYPVVGNTPSGFRDYPALEAAGAEVLRGSLRDPVHVFEGSIDFMALNTPLPATGDVYNLAWWGVEDIAE